MNTAKKTKMPATTKNWLTATAKKIAELTDCNDHGGALLMGCRALENLYAATGQDERGWGCNPFQLAGDFVARINEEHLRAGGMSHGLWLLRYGILNSIEEMGKQLFPEAWAIIRKGF